MAHMIQIENGKAQFAYRKRSESDIPWHRLGTPCYEEMTPEQMQEASGTDWSVVKLPLVARHRGQVLESGWSSLVRMRDGDLIDDQTLSVVPNDWEPIQNSEAFAFFHEYVMAGDMEMDTAGSLSDGQRVFVLAKIKEGFTLPGGDEIGGHLLFTNPHVYGKAADVRFTPIRVVCHNTLTMALNERSERMVKIRHTSKFNAEEVKETLGLAHTKMEGYKEMAEFLARRKFTKETLGDYFSQVFPAQGAKVEAKVLSRPAQKAFEVLDTQPGAEMSAGTWWHAFNTVTFLTDHVLGRSDETRLESAWYGPNRKRKLDALKLAVDFAEAAA